MSLRDYDRKRRFDRTPEPAGDAPARRGRRPRFVVQLHRASVRHYDFRLEVDGVLKSWAVPKGPSLRAGEKRLAVQVEDHPLSYAGFEGEIPKGNYGAGHVLVFDEGVWASEGDALEAIAAGKLDFVLHGDKLRGAWKLVRTAMRGGGKTQWLLLKRDDAFAGDLEADDLVEVEPGPVAESEPKPVVRASSPRAATPRKATATWARRAMALPGAIARPCPPGFKPELATLQENAPTGDEWLHEIKWDGYRMLADLVDGAVKLRSRNGLDWSGDFPEIAAAIAALPVLDARLDGELVALDAKGNSDFSALQRALAGSVAKPLRYVLFDLPGVAGIDLSAAPLLQRKQLLESLLAGGRGDVLAYSRHVVGHGPEVFAASARQGLEGIISKRIDAPYASTRSRHWLKVKHVQTDEFLVVGYSAPKGTRNGLGALLLATAEGGTLRYVGRVGTGFDDAALRALATQLKPLHRDKPTLPLPDHLPHDKRDRGGNIQWVEPRLVAEVAFRGWGKDGLLRHSSFQRLRVDKTAEDLGMDKTPQGKGGKKIAAIDTEGDADVRISSPDRLVYKDAKISKGDVAGYYRSIADWMLPQLAQRPLSLLRCPDGAAGECFFQKHHAAALGEHVQAISLQQKSGKEDYLYVRDVAGLLELVQMNTIEFHPWGSRVDKPERPDTLVFDLDPGDGVAWKEIVAAARDVRARLQEAGLDSYVRLSGGKGLHLVVPIMRGPDWDTAKGFCGAFAEALAAHQPQRYVATMSKAKRGGKIFIDWLRNGRGATSVASWSLRARPGAPVAMPLRWEELGRIKAPAAYDLHKALRRAATLKQDPWEGFAACRQRLPKLE